MRKFLIALPLLAAVPLIAYAAAGGMQHSGMAMPAVDTSKISGGNYTVDNHHTQVGWTINHLGFNDYFGIFGQITGTLTLDKAKPANSKVNITIPINEVATSRGDLTKHLMSPDFFDVAKYPTATFTSTSIVPMPGNMAKITGNLTLLGQTKPVVFSAMLTGAGPNMMSKKETVGFQATTRIDRTEWGMTKFAPALGAKVELRISAAFEKAA
jgi:polyisoprenoid-binding protein YceI